ncbi:MAG: hypothetical protein NDJ24_03840 [Alphaproteobacteria bacterium]|nr:hypothetical protein [Alphaproteobacteria bacterium]
MDSEILYECARVNVYRDLDRALAPLARNTLGVLAQECAQISGFHNQARLYLEAGIATTFVTALRGFCQARLQGMTYEEARGVTLAPYEEIIGFTADERAMMLLPGSYYEVMAGQTDEQKEVRYRYRHVDEFDTLLSTLNNYLADGDNHFWGHRIVTRHIREHLVAFSDLANKQPDFGHLPVSTEECYFQNVLQWLRAHGLLADAKLKLGDRLHTAGVGPLFEQAVGDNPGIRHRLVHYSTHCEVMADHLSQRLQDGLLPALLSQAAIEQGSFAEPTQFDMTSVVTVDRHKALFSFLQDYIIATQAELVQMEIDGESLGPDYARESQAALQQLSLDLLAAFRPEKSASPVVGVSTRQPA